VHKIRKTLALLALALGACGEGASSQPAPADRFSYPTGLALHTLGDGTRALVVVSSNSDLRYDPDDGGSVMVVDPDASSGNFVAVRSVQRIPSFGAGLAIVSSRDEATTPAVDPTCPQWTGADQVLVTSRGANALLRIGLADDGALSCGDGCRVEFDADLVDPYAVAVACWNEAGGPLAQAYVSHLGSPGGQGFLTRFDLLAPDSARERLLLSSAPTQDLAWDSARRRLFVTSRFQTIGLAPLRWLDLAFSPVVFDQVNLNNALRGADTRGIALAAPAADTGFSTRAYVAARVFDQDLALTLGGRTPDVAGALMVIDVTDDRSGRPTSQVTRIVPVGIGASQVHVLPVPQRPAGQELVVVTSDEGSISIYDAAVESVVRVLAIASADSVAPGPFQPPEFEDPASVPVSEIPRDEAVYHAGEKLFGDSPFALASEQLPDGRVRLYVSSFDRGFIAQVQLDPAAPAAAQVTKRFGRRHP
jgi:hypothetical protein